MNDQPNADELEAHLARFAESLLRKRDEAVEGRAASGIERQWREDQRAFEGIDGATPKTDMIDYATGESWLGAHRGQSQRRSKVVVNIVRGKCETAEGRFSEIVLPSDDKNWGLLTSPNPEAAFPQQMPGQMLTMQQAPQMPQMGQANPGAQAMPGQSGEDAEIKKRCGAMEDEIDDQLEECGFNAECRKVQRSAIRLGTGVLKGPDIVKRVRRAWVEQTDGIDSVYVMKSVESLKPSSTCRDIWNIYPDPHCGTDPKRGAYIWERDHILPREVKALFDIPGYNRQQLFKVLQEEPIRTTVTLDKGGSQRTQATTIRRGAPYERWEYHGDVDREDLEAMGCECPEDDSRSFSACVVFINDRPVKVQLNALDTGELPYDFFRWVQIEDSPWGIGEPRKLIWQQRIITAAWRAMMDNAGDSAGAQIVINKDVIPDDDVWEITGKKIWVNEAENGDVRNAFAQFQIANNQAELQNIIELSLKFIDMESGTPMLAQGEKGSSPETLGGMQMLMAAADTTRRHQVKMWDDDITRPHIRRYYDWNMQYSKKREIKGDFEVDPRGTSVLLVKDAQVQKLMQVMQLRADPEVNIQVDWAKAIKQLFTSMHLDVLKSDEEIDAARKQAASQPPPVAPQVQVAQIRADVEMKKSAAEMQTEQQEGEKDRNLELVLAQVKERIESIKDQGAREIAFSELKGMLASTAMKLNVQKDLSLSDHVADLHKHHNPQIMTPPTEPTGKASPGQAFSQ